MRDALHKLDGSRLTIYQPPTQQVRTRNDKPSSKRIQLSRNSLLHAGFSSTLLMITNTNSNPTYPVTGLRFCRSVILNRENEDDSSSSQYVSGSASQKHSPSRIRRDNPGPQNQLYELPVGHTLVTLHQGPEIVRYQPMEISLNRSPGEMSPLRWIAVGATLTAVCWCLLQANEHLSALQATEMRRTQTVETLASAFTDQNSKVVETGKQVRALTRALEVATAAVNSYSNRSSSAQSDERRLDKAISIMEQLLSTQKPLSEAGTWSEVGEKPPDSLVGPSANSMVSLPNEEYNFDSKIPTIPGAVVHRKQTGQADYWILARPGYGSEGQRAVPFATLGSGVAVHSVDDGHEYIVTPTGDWLKYGP